MIWQPSRTFIHEEHRGSFKIILDTEKRTERCKKQYKTVTHFETSQNEAKVIGFLCNFASKNH